jgi:hypothetical protein
MEFREIFPASHTPAEDLDLILKNQSPDFPKWPPAILDPPTGNNAAQRF